MSRSPTPGASSHTITAKSRMGFGVRVNLIWQFGTGADQGPIFPLAPAILLPLPDRVAPGPLGARPLEMLQGQRSWARRLLPRRGVLRRGLITFPALLSVLRA